MIHHRSSLSIPKYLNFNLTKYFIILFTLLLKTYSWSNLISTGFNQNFQTGVRTLMTTGKIQNGFATFNIIFTTPMATATVNSAIGIIGLDYTMKNKNFGWDLIIQSVLNTDMNIEMESVGNNQNNITFLKICYLVSDHPLIDTDYYNITFDPTVDVVANTSLYDANYTLSSCNWFTFTTTCRKTIKVLNYDIPKLTANIIKLRPFLSGFYVKNQIPFSGAPTSTFFAIQLIVTNFAATNFQIHIKVYQWFQFSSISFFTVYYQQKTVQLTYQTWAFDNQGTIGCYYQNVSCSTPTAINTYDTASLIANIYSADIHFVGISRIFVEYDGSNTKKGNFVLDNTTLVGSLKWRNSITFSGNTNNFFRLSFSYVIIMDAYCNPAGPDKYLALNRINCNNTCNNGLLQYFDLNNFCQTCDPICYKCQSTATQCTACYSSQFRILSGNTCICDPIGYYDNLINITCQKCHYSCKSCNGPSSSQCTACEPLDNRFFDLSNSCPCVQTYYDNLAPTCTKCNYQCLTCYGANSNNCLACDNITGFRYAGTGNTCPCQQRYYNVANQPICQKCYYTCLTCNAVSTNCTSCNITNPTFREFDPINYLCNCQAGYYDQGVSIKSQICLKCHDTCLTCNGPASSDCLTCDSTKNRMYQLGYCICFPKFYNNYSLITTLNTCLSCHYSCFNCTLSSSANSCSNCDSLVTHRYYLNGTKECLCQNGYVEVVGNPICQLCNYTCLTCSISSTNCTSCNSLYKRELLGNQCVCIYGYVDVLLTGVCSICHYSCETCFGILSTQCLTCNTTIRSFNSLTDSCDCLTHTYDNGVSQNCFVCNDQCLNCSNGYNTTCTSCDLVNNFRQLVVSSCNCIQHYYEQAPTPNPICQLCSLTCFQCTSLSTKCLSCYTTTQFRIISSNYTCDCMNGYYQTGVPICVKCSYPCLTCTLTSTNCLSCDLTLNRIFNSTFNQCLCKAGTFQNLTNFLCQTCHYSCKTCMQGLSSIGNQVCLSCNSLHFRVLSGGVCLCASGYYDNLTSLCVKCPYSCLTCTFGASPTSAPNCTSCPSLSLRTLIGTSCVCPLKTFDDGFNALCQQCSQKCQTCITSYDICTSCNATKFRSLVLNDCKCLAGYYQPLPLGSTGYICLSCHYSCLECFSGSSASCITCQTNRTFLASNSSCICSLGFYSISTSCLSCDSSCLTCITTSTNCLSCDSTIDRVLQGNQCKCKNGTFQNGPLLCSSCDVQCQNCQLSSSNCLSCNLLHGSILVGNQCQCPTNYYRNLSLICNGCHFSCLDCTGLLDSQCSTCDLNKNRMLYTNGSGSYCICSFKFYSNPNISSNVSCLPCNSQCQNCFGSSIYNCSSCNFGYTLIGTTCMIQKNCTNFYYEGQCINLCPTTTYPLNNQCFPCQKSNNCKTCINSSYCLSCTQASNAFLDQLTHSCVKICDSSSIAQFINFETKKCQQCPIGCQSCFFNNLQTIIQLQIVCKNCTLGYYLYNYTICKLGCPSETYVIVDMIYCVKCIGNCLKCNAISPNSCYQCQQGFYLYNSTLTNISISLNYQGMCLKLCPQGFYPQKKNKKCLFCQQTCKKCSQNECLICKSGYYKFIEESNVQKCIPNNYFYDLSVPESGFLSKCHPNCQSCTNTSFSSCISCSKNRGDNSQMAISGYCVCHPNSIDIGNGQCDFIEYKHIIKLNQVLISMTSSCMFFAGITSIATLNFLPSFYFINQLQALSVMFYLNSTSVMQTNKILSYFGKFNPNYFLMQTSKDQNQFISRILETNNVGNQNYQNISSFSIQSDSSLFMRGSQFQYLSQWALSILIFIAILWLILFLTKYIISKLWNDYNSQDQEQKIFEKQIQQKQLKNDSKQQHLEISNKSKYKSKSRCQKYTKRFFKYSFQGLPILLHILTSTSISFYATATFKILLLDSSIQINYFHLIFSIILTLYYIVYQIRLIIGSIIPVFSFQSKQNRNFINNQKYLTLLYHSFSLKQKSFQSFTKRLYIPLIILRNMISSVLIVLLSSDPNKQIQSVLIIYTIFLVYQTIFNPYPILFRILLTLQDLTMYVQIIILFIIIRNQQDSQKLIPAQVFIFLNFLLILFIILICIVAILSLNKKYRCLKDDLKNNNNKILNQKSQNMEASQLVINQIKDTQQEFIQIQEKDKQINDMSQQAFKLINIEEDEDNQKQKLEYVQDIPRDRKDLQRNTKKQKSLKNNQQDIKIIQKQYLQENQNKSVADNEDSNDLNKNIYHKKNQQKRVKRYKIIRQQ